MIVSGDLWGGIDQYLLVVGSCFGMESPKQGGVETPAMLTDLKTKRSSRKLSTFVCTHWQCWFCVSSAPVVRSAILRFFSHGVLFVKFFLCAPVSVCLKGP